MEISIEDTVGATQVNKSARISIANAPSVVNESYDKVDGDDKWWNTHKQYSYRVLTNILKVITICQLIKADQIKFIRLDLSKEVPSI